MSNGVALSQVVYFVSYAFVDVRPSRDILAHQGILDRARLMTDDRVRLPTAMSLLRAGRNRTDIVRSPNTGRRTCWFQHRTEGRATVFEHSSVLLRRQN